MNKEIDIWNFKGYVYLNKEFVEFYEERVKEYGVTKLAHRLDVDYATVADAYRRNKLVSIGFLEGICKILKIDRRFAEKSVICFTQNLKSKYHIKFPIKITPLHLRAVSMIVGDGTGSLGKCCRWSQKSSNFQWGINLIETIIKYKSHAWNPTAADCKIFVIPNFLVESIAIFLGLKGKEIKSVEFFEKVCELSMDWQFQVFAQIVVDEGSPDRSFIITQNNGEIKDGIVILMKSLGYSGSKLGNCIYVYTESFPKIKKDFESAKRKFGNLGGFWFKDKRFEAACEVVDPGYSKTLHSNDKKFIEVIEKLKPKKGFSYKDLLSLSSMKCGAIFKRLNRLLKKNKIIRIGKGKYIFPETLNKDEVEYLTLSKEEKVFDAISKGFMRRYEIMNATQLGSTEFFRATEILINKNKIRRIGWGKYELDNHMRQ